MEYRRLGRSGLQLSVLCCGALQFGARASEKTAQRILGTCRDAGINFIDTADRYNMGASEEIVGRLIKKNRGDWVLATKVGNAGDDEKVIQPNKFGLGRKWLLEGLDNSLRRLRTDYIDIWYFHMEDHGSYSLGPPSANVEATYKGNPPEGGPWYDLLKDDPGTPLEETILTIGDVIRSGKVRYFGVSNHKGWRIAHMCALCDRYGIPRPVASQPYYNAMNRMVEVEHLPACEFFGIGVVPYSAMGRGVLTGKYIPGKPPPPNSRIAVRNFRIIQADYRQESLEHAQRIKAYAEVRGITAGQFAVNWVLNSRSVSSVLTGARTVGQMKQYLGALAYTFTAEDESFIDSLVPAGHPSTPGFTDPLTPVEGRLPRTR